MEEKGYYINGGQFESGMLQQQPWNSFLFPQEVNSISSSQFVVSNDHLFTQFQSTVTVPTSSSVVHNGDSVGGIREFIAKLGPNLDSGRNPLPFSPTTTTTFSSSSTNHHTNNNVYRVKQQQGGGGGGVSLPNSLVLNHPLPAISTDPDFAERAAKFSCFGSRSFNARTAISDVDTLHRSSTTSAMARVRSSPSLKQSGSPVDNQNSEIKKLDRLSSFNQHSNDSSSVSGHVLSGETAVSNSRKRKAIPKSRAKENGAPASTVDDSHKDEGNYEKRAKTADASPSENGSISKEDGEEDKAKNGVDESLDEEHKPDIKMAQKAIEPPKDYIHVRARRGQATDSHSLAERVRREKIGERMKLLQDLVPGCNKVTGKALMLDEIINYVQSLQCQVEFLSMKLASVDPRQEVNVDNFSSKDVMQRNGSLPQSFYPGDSSLPGLYGHQPKQYPQMHTDRQSPVEPMHKTTSHNLELQLPLVNEFTDCLPQFPAFSEEDLHSIVGMGFAPNGQMEADFMQ